MSNTSIVTYTGKMFDFMAPEPSMICIEDIAHQLACNNRYNGSTRVPYSVAEHCVRMSYMVVGDPLVNLLHDAAEAYIADICKPQKENLGWQVYDIELDAFRFSRYSVREDTILEIIYVGLGLGLQTHPQSHIHYLRPPDTKKADNIMLVTEIRDLMPRHEDYDNWIKDIKPLPETIVPWDWKRAESKYLRRFKELTI